MSAKQIRLIWVVPGTVHLLQTLRLSQNQLLIVQTPPRHLEYMAKVLHGEARILAVVADDEDLRPYVGAFEIIKADLTSEKVMPLAFAKDAFRPNLEDRYTAYCRQSDVLPEGMRVDVRAPKTSVSIAPKQDITKFENLHKGKRIYVLGNGPSLADVEPTLLKSAVTIGSNAVHLMFETWGFPVTYWMCEDRLQIEQELERHREAIGSQSIPLLPFDYAATVDWPEAFYYPLSMSDGHIFPDGVSFPDFAPKGRAFRHGYTVTTSAIHLAAYMGASEIVLLGVDHNYELAGEREQTWSDDQASSPTHFDKSYTAGRQFIRPRPLRAEQAYQAAREWCEVHGVRIVNASPKSALDVFERVIL